MHHVHAQVYVTSSGLVSERITCSCRSESSPAELAGLPSAEAALFGRRAICVGIRAMDRLECVPVNHEIRLSDGRTVFCPRAITVAEDGTITEVDGIPTDGVVVRRA